MKKEVEEIVSDAEDLLTKAIEEMNVDLRDATEKAWGLQSGLLMP